MKTFSFAIGFLSSSHSLAIYKFLSIFHNHYNNDEQYLFLIFIRFTTIIQIFTALSYNFKSISSTHSKDKAEKNLKKPHQNLMKSVIKLGAGAILELVATNRLENSP